MARSETIRTPDGRLVVDHLPATVPVSPDEVELAAQWLLDVLDGLFEATAVEVM